MFFLLFIYLLLLTNRYTAQRQPRTTNESSRLVGGLLRPSIIEAGPNNPQRVVGGCLPPATPRPTTNESSRLVGGFLPRQTTNKDEDDGGGKGKKAQETSLTTSLGL